jgi:hypothetical protein
MAQLPDAASVASSFPPIVNHDQSRGDVKERHKIVEPQIDSRYWTRSPFSWAVSPREKVVS